MQVNTKLNEFVAVGGNGKCIEVIMVLVYSIIQSLTDILWSRWNDCTYRRNYFSCLIIILNVKLI